MDEGLDKASSESVVSIVDKSWSLITPNTEILAFMLCGVIGTILEVAGYWPMMKMTDLFPGNDELDTDFTTVLYKISEGVEVARIYSVHIYLAAYILLPYPLLTETQKVLLTPWLICGVLRSLLLSILNSLTGVTFCASHNQLHYPCLQYSVWNGAEFCISLYVWTSVHNFYHFLDKKKENQLGKVLNTIHKAGLMRRMSVESSRSSALLSLDNFEDEDSGLGTEVTLVERAAMAWIAREILESDGEYVTDSQFSQYLAIKATMELRQIIKELAEKKVEKERTNRPLTIEERINESLEFCRTISRHHIFPKEVNQLKLEAFELSESLSRRDPLRRLRPLITQGKPYVAADESDDQSFIISEHDYRGKESSLSTGELSQHSIEVQTDPLTPEMAQLFDVLERQQARQQVTQKNGQEKRTS